MATTQQIKNFIEKIGADAVKVCNERHYGDAQAWTCICQAALESGWGTAGTMTAANAYFGIKATPAWVKAAKYGGLVYSSKTREVYSGKSVTITDTFRAYRSSTDSIRDYFDLLELPRYSESLKAGNVSECITAIKNGGYATDPNYISSINSIFKAYREEITKYKTQAAKKSNEEIAAEVIAGAWGNGAQRKQALTEAGYNYSQIQYLVNALVKGVKRVQVTAWQLNVRNGAGVQNEIAAVLNKGDEVEITQEQTAGGCVWGLCNKGWINLKHTKEI